MTKTPPNRTTDVRVRRVLLVVTSHTYRAQAFLDAAERLGIEIVLAIDMPKQLADYWGVSLGLNLQDLDGAVRAVVEFAQESPLDAILAVDDSGSLLSAQASVALNLPHNSVEAAEAARDKYRMRRLFSRAGIASPDFQRFHTDDDPDEVAVAVSYPCVVKPLALSGSRGVIRANDPTELVGAIARLDGILLKEGPGPRLFLVEKFIPGFEVALEGLLDDGRLTVLALFDKPDPLDGPFFEETLYVTPSRLPPEVQEAVRESTARAAAVLGLRMGSIHAELRVNEEGPWILEVAGRSIGGLCSQTLRFGTDVSLEELILRQACGLEFENSGREEGASGVMMIPIPEAGLLKEIRGCEDAKAVPLIESVEITAKLNYPLVPLPEGESYLGFIFARGETPVAVEDALRLAHSKLQFDISPHFALMPNGRV
jgi:biotin carboxylase